MIEHLLSGHVAQSESAKALKHGSEWSPQEHTKNDTCNKSIPKTYQSLKNIPKRCNKHHQKIHLHELFHSLGKTSKLCSTNRPSEMSGYILQSRLNPFSNRYTTLCCVLNYNRKLSIDVVFLWSFRDIPRYQWWEGVDGHWALISSLVSSHLRLAPEASQIRAIHYARQ